MRMRIFALAVALIMILALPAMATETVTVNGEGLVYMDADQATFYVGVRETGEDVMYVQNAVNQRIAEIIAAFEKIGIEKKDMSTNSINIYPVYDYSESGEKISGYSAYNSICVLTKDIARVGEYIDTAFANGANTLDSVNFSASDTTEASKQALKLAVKSAKDKAEVLAEAAGMEITGVQTINEQSAYSYGNGMLRYTESATMDMAAGTQILTSQLQVCANVSVTYTMQQVEFD